MSNEMLNEIDIMDAIPKELWQRMHEWLKEHPQTLYIHYSDSLNRDQVGHIMNGEEWKVYDELDEVFIDAIYDLEREAVKDCIDEFENDIMEATGLDEVDWEEFFYETDLRYGTIVDKNYDSLANNFQPRIALNLHVDHPYIPGGVYADEVEDILDFFNINPKTIMNMVNHEDFRSDWKKRSKRDGNEYVRPRDMVAEWNNMFYSGQYVALVTVEDLFGFFHNLHNPPEGMKPTVTLPKDTFIISHDYWNGSSGIGFRLQREMRLDIEPDDFRLDQSNKYGLDAVSVFTWETWDTPLEIEFVKETA